MSWRPGLRTVVAASGLLAILLLAGILWQFSRLPMVTERQTLLDLQHQGYQVSEAWLREFEDEMAGPGARAAGSNEVWRWFQRYRRDWNLPRSSRENPELAADQTLRAARDDLLADYPEILPRLEFRTASLPRLEFPVPQSPQKHAILNRAGQALEPQLERVAERTLSGLTVVDHHGDVIASSERAWRGRQAQSANGPGALPGVEEIEIALQSGIPQARRRHRRVPGSAGGPLARDTAWQVSVAVPIVKAGHVLGAVHVVRTPPTILEALRADEVAPSLITLAILLFLLPLSVLATLQFFAIAPLRDLATRMRKAARPGSPGLEAPRHPRTREIAELASALVELTTRQQEHLRTEKTRTEDASVRADDFAHSIKNKSVTILNFINSLRQGHDQLTPAERNALLAGIETATEQTRHMAVEALAFERALEPGDPAATFLLHEALEEAAEASPGLKFRGLDDDKLQCWIALDEASLVSIFDRLCENAEQHAASTVRIQAKREAEFLQLDFADDGNGIDLDDPDKIFDRGFTANHKGGTGLGLAIVRRLLERYGGSIRYLHDSIGAHFRLHLPLNPSPPIPLERDDETVPGP